ncbi:MAG: hypothetical protein ABI841_08045 [Chloroflexota bacterium]
MRNDKLRWATVALVLVTAVSAGAFVGFAASRLPAFASSTAIDPLLDGARELQPGPLADLALARTRMGATWLAGVGREDGSFFYIYYPEAREFEAVDYNEVRHAGTTYSLFQAYDVLRDERVLDAAERAAQYIEDHSVPAGDGGLAFTYEGRMKLGGQALALVALLERRRVLGDDSRDELISGLSEFMMSLELADEPGRYYQSYDAALQEPSLEPDSDYYPGEALLALTRLARHYPDGPYLDAAERAAEYLVHRRDGDIPEAGQVPREDHWLALALSELYQLSPDASYRDVAYLQAESMVANQFTAADGPMRAGGSALQSPINYTSTATKGEALVAVWAMAAATGDDEAAARYAAAARRNAQFQLRVQFTPENTELFPDPEMVIGAWGKDALDPWIRIDFVQHNISALIGVWSMTTEGSLPVPTPID